MYLVIFLSPMYNSLSCDLKLAVVWLWEGNLLALPDILNDA